MLESSRPSNSPVGTICSRRGRRASPSSRPSNSPVGTIPNWQTEAQRPVFPAFQFPSWYNKIFKDLILKAVFPAFQFPSWYNWYVLLPQTERVFPAFQFPSWYNTGTKKAPVNRGFLGKARQRNDVYVSRNGHPFAVFQNPLAEKRIAHRNQKVRWAYLAGNHSDVIPLSTR